MGFQRYTHGAIFGRMLDNSSKNYPNAPPEYAAAGTAGAKSLTAAAPGLTATGYGNLGEILRSQGRSDPIAMNRLLDQIATDTQGAQQSAEGLAAKKGFQNSGLNVGLQSSIENAGISKRADVRSAEIQKAEERKRSDLQLLTDLILNPQLAYAGLGEEGRQADARTRAQREAALYAYFGNVVQSIGTATSGIGGGGAGKAAGGGGGGGGK